MTSRLNAGSKHGKKTKSKTDYEQPLPQTQQQMLAPPPSMPALGNPSPDLTPIHSNNPTPDPIPTKKMRMGSSSSSNSSSSSSSGSSDSESEKEENVSHASHVTSHVTQPAFPFTSAQDIQYISSQSAPQAPLNQFLQMPVPPSQPRLSAPVPSQMPVLPMTHSPAVKQASSSSSSSSGSDSDSSSGSSSSNSSSESSDDENGGETVRRLAHCSC